MNTEEEEEEEENEEDKKKEAKEENLKELVKLVILSPYKSGEKSMNIAGVRRR